MLEMPEDLDDNLATQDLWYQKIRTLPVARAVIESNRTLHETSATNFQGVIFSILTFSISDLHGVQLHFHVQLRHTSTKRLKHEKAEKAIHKNL